MEKIEYKNSKIEFEESSNPEISIDGKTIQVSLDSEAQSFSTAELPYYSFETMSKLAEAIVDQRLQPPS